MVTRPTSLIRPFSRFTMALQVFLFLLFILLGTAQADPGELDATFGILGKVTTDFGSLASEPFSEDDTADVSIQPDRKIVVAGRTLASQSRRKMAVARYLNDGSLDPGFGSGGRVAAAIGTVESGAAAVLVQPDGKILVAGYAYGDFSGYDFALVRYDADGAPDAGFGSGGIVTTNLTRDDKIAAIVIQGDGKIVVGGFTDNFQNYNAVFAMVRYHPNGVVDATFGVDGKVITDIGPGPEGISSVLIQEDEKIIAVGTRDGSHIALARYGSNGVLDASFGSGGIVSIPVNARQGASGQVHSAIFQPDGKIVLAADSWHSSDLYGTNYDVVMVRFNADGTLDGGFGNGGRVLTDVGEGTDELATGLLLDRGRLIVTGYIFRFSALTNRIQSDFLLLRYLSDGRLDPTFGEGGHAISDFASGGDDLAVALSLQANGGILVAGESVQSGAERDFVLARYLNEPIDIDPPGTSIELSPLPNPAGWHHTDVRVTLTAAEPAEGSGVKEIRYAVGEGAEVIVPGETADLALSSEGVSTVRYYAVDHAENAEAPRFLSVRIDKTGPDVLSSHAPAANSAGWNKTAVTVQFEGGDALSGGEACTPSAVPVAAEGADQAIETVCADAAGNLTSGSRRVSIDRTPPDLILPLLDATYPLNSAVPFPYGAFDSLSGLSSVSATLDGHPVSNGETVAFAEPGRHTFLLTASDRAGNSASRSQQFTIVGDLSFTFLPPLASHGGRKVFQLGSVIPVKFRLTDSNGSAISSAVAHLSLQRYVEGKPMGAPIPATSNIPGSGDRFRFTGKHYAYQLNTKPLSKGVWELRVSLDDGSVHTVRIKLKGARYVVPCDTKKYWDCSRKERDGEEGTDRRPGRDHDKEPATRSPW